MVSGNSQAVLYLQLTDIEKLLFKPKRTYRYEERILEAEHKKWRKKTKS